MDEERIVPAVIVNSEEVFAQVVAVRVNHDDLVATDGVFVSPLPSAVFPNWGPELKKARKQEHVN